MSSNCSGISLLGSVRRKCGGRMKDCKIELNHERFGDWEMTDKKFKISFEKHLRCFPPQYPS